MIALKWVLSTINTVLSTIFLVLIRLYQLFLSPLLGANCRFAPTCSGYAQEAIALHGPFRGGWLAVCRIGRCHPWGGMGYDPVPPAHSDHSH